ncbi:MAG: phage terminase large subunit [Candidatus Caldarchaeum sp.]
MTETPLEVRNALSAIRLYERGYRSNPLLDRVFPNAHPKQRWFLALEDLEVMYGGAAAGGKSQALLAAALQYIDVPGYSALILRRTYSDLALPGALMDRAAQWLNETEMIKRDGGIRWDYPNGGTLQFGYLSDTSSRYRYQSSEFTYIAFDELTQIPEEDYRYLFSRLRKPSGLDRSSPLSKVPLRFRSATNPSGPYSDWVKKAFITRKYLESPEDVQFSRIWIKEGLCLLCEGRGYLTSQNEVIACYVCRGSGYTKRIFVPARLQDNPSVDEASYRQSLSMLPEQERQSLEHGRWDIVTEGNLFRDEWKRTYRWQGDLLVLPKPSTPPDSRDPEGYDYIDRNHQWRFLTVDSASSLRTTADYTVISVWIVCEPHQQLCWLESFRGRLMIPNILDLIYEYWMKHSCRFVIIEEASSGTALIQEAQTTRRYGMTVIPYRPGNRDKVQRSLDAQIRMKTGQIFFPREMTPTHAECYNELMLFPDGAYDDFVDTLSMAAWYVAGRWRSQEGLHHPAHQIRKPVFHPRISSLRSRYEEA